MPNCPNHKSKKEVKATFRFCFECFKHASGEHQKALYAAYRNGQGISTEPSEEFNSILALIEGDINYHRHGARVPDKIVYDSGRKPLIINDIVEWGDEDENRQFVIQQGKIVAAYWDTQEVTVRYYLKERPLMKRKPSDKVTFVRH